jgi:hypothetical protein
VPKSVRAAAYEFGHGPIPTDRAWKLGAEAFFRAYASSIGLERIDNATYTAAHLEVSAPGALTAVAKGPIQSGGPEGYLLWTSDDDGGAFGWLGLVVDVPPMTNTFTFATMPSVDRAKEEDDIDMTGSNRSIILWKPDGGPHGRNRKDLDAFMATAGPLMAEVVAASVRV